jgi:hypothetical protein
MYIICININMEKEMNTFEIETIETVPVVKKYVYTVDAASKEEAESKFKDGDYKDVSHVKDISILSTTETEITDISEIE